MATLKTAQADDVNLPDDIDEGDIGEQMARAAERVAGEVPPPSDEELREFRKAIYAYYDCEAFLDDDGMHICNLIVVQWGINEKQFRGNNAQDEFCKWALSKDHSNWTFIAHNAKRYFI